MKIINSAVFLATLTTWPESQDLEIVEEASHISLIDWDARFFPRQRARGVPETRMENRRIVRGVEKFNITIRTVGNTRGYKDMGGRERGKERRRISIYKRQDSAESSFSPGYWLSSNVIVGGRSRVSVSMCIHGYMPRERRIVVSNLDYPLLLFVRISYPARRALLPVCVFVIIHWRLYHRIYIAADRDAWKAKRADLRLRIVRSKLARKPSRIAEKNGKRAGQII